MVPLLKGIFGHFFLPLLDRTAKERQQMSGVDSGGIYAANG